MAACRVGNICNDKQSKLRERGYLMKKAFIAILALALALALAGCGSNQGSPSSSGASSSGGQSSSDAQFSSLSWSGEAIEFTVKEELILVGISVFANGVEFEGKYVSNSQGNMGFASGTTLKPGSSIGFHDGLIVYAGTTASCAIDTGGVEVDSVCFYLSDGTKLERQL